MQKMTLLSADVSGLNGKTPRAPRMDITRGVGYHTRNGYIALHTEDDREFPPPFRGSIPVGHLAKVNTWGDYIYVMFEDGHDEKARIAEMCALALAEMVAEAERAQARAVDLLKLCEHALPEPRDMSGKTYMW